MRRGTFVAGLLCLIIGVTGCHPGAPPPILIGHVSDNARPDKAGQQAERGIRLALHELAKGDALAEEFNGRGLEVRHTDTRGQVDAFESQAVRLDSVNRCLALIGGLSVPETVALNGAKVPVLTLQGQPAPGATNLVFYIGVSPGRQGTVLASVVADDAKVKKITILMNDKRPDAIAFVDAFQKTFLATTKNPTAATIQSIRFSDEVNPPIRLGEDLRWREMIERMVNQEPQAVVFAGSVHDFNLWRKVLRREFPDFKPRVIYAGGDGDHRLFDLHAGETKAILLASAFYADAADPKIAAFMKAYQTAFALEADVHAANAYDGMRILVEAIKASGPTPTPERVRENLLKIKDFPGLTGLLTVTGERKVQRPVFVVGWQNGALKLVKTFGSGHQGN
jgi:branched-chain amino acid transport system substrate-binding protein